MYFTDDKIDSFKFNEENNTIEIVKRLTSGTMYASNPPQPVPDTIWKEIYGVENGKIKLIEKITGKHIPASYNHEKITFEEK